MALLALVAVLGVLLAIGLASDDGGDDDAADAPETTAERTQTQTEEAPPPPTRVRVRIEPVTLTYMCADRGPGTDVLFEQSTDAAQTFRGKRVRLLLGKRDVVDNDERRARRGPARSGADRLRVHAEREQGAPGRRGPVRVAAHD